jgi:hypothetical protein
MTDKGECPVQHGPSGKGGGWSALSWLWGTQDPVKQGQGQGQTCPRNPSTNELEYTQEVHPDQRSKLSTARSRSSIPKVLVWSAHKGVYACACMCIYLTEEYVHA